MQDSGANVLRDAEECLPVSPVQSPKPGDVNPCVGDTLMRWYRLFVSSVEEDQWSAKAELPEGRLNNTQELRPRAQAEATR